LDEEEDENSLIANPHSEYQQKDISPEEISKLVATYDKKAKGVLNSNQAVSKEAFMKDPSIERRNKERYSPKD
jgi:hypothetical protein